MDHEKVVEGVQSVAVAIAKEVPVLGTAVKLTIAVRDGFLASGDKRLDDWVREEVREVVLRQFPEAVKRIEALESAGAGPKVSDFVHVANAFARAWTTSADSKKRKLLEDAFVRSFDRELYESGLLNALWDRLDRLAYGDLQLLARLAEVAVEDEASDQSFHEFKMQLGFGMTTSLTCFHAGNLKREGLLTSDADDAYVTDLGRRMRDLAWSQLPEPGTAGVKE